MSKFTISHEIHWLPTSVLCFLPLSGTFELNCIFCTLYLHGDRIETNSRSVLLAPPASFNFHDALYGLVIGSTSAARMVQAGEEDREPTSVDSPLEKVGIFYFCHRDWRIGPVSSLGNVVWRFY